MPESSLVTLVTVLATLFFEDLLLLVPLLHRDSEWLVSALVVMVLVVPAPPSPPEDGLPPFVRLCRWPSFPSRLCLLLLLLGSRLSSLEEDRPSYFDFGLDDFIHPGDAAGGGGGSMLLPLALPLFLLVLLLSLCRCHSSPPVCVCLPNVGR